jgi:Anaphase-promoting complex subunit 4 WD40 domain
LLIIYGPSGSGKSSLARAGLIPELERRTISKSKRHSAKFLLLSPKDRPLEAMAMAMAKIELSINDVEATTGKINQRCEEIKLRLKLSNSEGFYEELRKFPKALNLISPLIILIDQLEDLFVLCEEEERNAFMGNLENAIKDSSKEISAIITMRTDFLNEIQKYPWLNELIDKQGTYISALNVQGLREAITSPAKGAGYTYNPSTISLLIEQTKEREGALPLLQFTLTEIWDDLKEGKAPAESLEELGGVSKALAKKAKKVYNQFTDSEKLQVKRIFIQLVSPDGESEYIRRIANRDEIGQENWNLVTRLANNRLVVTNRNRSSKKETVELAHETLIREWDLLHAWMEENRAFRLWQRRLRSNQKQWEDTKKDNGSLLRGINLAEAEDWLSKRPTEITEAEKLFIKLSNQVQSRSRKLIIQGSFIFSTISLTLTLIAIIGWINLARQNRIANAERSSVSALRQRDEAPIEALISAMEGGEELKDLVGSNFSLEDYPTMHPILALQTILDEIRLRNQVYTFERAVNSITFNTKLTLMATAGDKGKVQLWRIDGTRIKEIKAYSEDVKINSIRFNSDGDKLAIAGNTGDAQVRNLEGNLLYTIHTKSVKGVRNIRFGSNKNSDLLITSGNDGRVILWNKKGTYIRELIDENIKNDVKLAHIGGVEVVNLSKDDKYILTGGKDDFAKLWAIDGTLKASL